MQFAECKKCKNLYLLTEDQKIEDISCEKCHKSDFQLTKAPFLIYCPKCFEYWSERVISRVIKPGLCICPALDCDGHLIIKNHFPGMKSDKNSEINQKKGHELKHKANPAISEPFSNPQTNHQLKSPVISPIAGKPVTLAKSPQESIPESSQELVFNPPKDLDVELSSLKSTLKSNTIDQFLLSMKLSPKIESIFLELKDFQNIFETFLLQVSKNYQSIRKDEIATVFYIGDLVGDFSQVQRICSYFIPLLTNFPACKIIFLGNYFDSTADSIYAFTLLALLYLKFPKNIILLRSRREFRESLEKSKIFSQFAEIFISRTQSPKKQQYISEIKDLYRYTANIFKFLPFFHIGEMNNGNIRIFSTNAGFPKDPLDSLESAIKSPVFDFKDLDPQIRTALLGVPIDIARDAVSDSLFHTVSFSSDDFVSFMRINNFHYCVRSFSPIPVKFLFNDILCSVYSANLYENDKIKINLKTKRKGLTTGKKGKLIRLTPGKSPLILSIDGELTRDLIDNFGISSED
ncbi:MAG: hypothetical protein ACTSVU_09295 [Promethearchaeota archaeon]